MQSSFGANRLLVLNDLQGRKDPLRNAGVLFFTYLERKPTHNKADEWAENDIIRVVSRDLNAAVNIKSFALKNILSGTDRKNQGKLPTLVGALTLEAQSIGSAVGG